MENAAKPEPRATTTPSKSIKENEALEIESNKYISIIESLKYELAEKDRNIKELMATTTDLEENFKLYDNAPANTCSSCLGELVYCCKVCNKERNVKDEINMPKQKILCAMKLNADKRKSKKNMLSSKAVHTAAKMLHKCKLAQTSVR